MEIYKKKDMEDSDDLYDELEAHADSLKLKMHGKEEGAVSDAADKYGICKDCESFEFVVFEFCGQIARCDCYRCRLSGSQRITECNQYNQRGRLTLAQMQEMAWIIDLGSKKVGFGT